jgi:hypothetical protein
MSDTPRTDAASWREHQQSVADADFARQLDRELAAAIKQRDEAQRIGAMPRRAQNHGERTPDETFRLSVFQPFAVLFAERGWLTADDKAIPPKYEMEEE